ncbi:hypothetical protein V8F20_009949 [Naviculisporaceae sp. PSN 640]
MLSDMMYNTRGKLPSRRQTTSCRWSPFETPKSPERRCLGHGMRISRPRSADRRQGSGRVPRAIMRKHPNRIVMLRGGRGGLSAVVRRHFRAWQQHSAQPGQNIQPESASLMSLTANEISDLNDLLVKLSLSEPMAGVVYDTVMDDDLDIQTQPLHDDGQPREAITALACPTPRIPTLDLSSPLLTLPDLDLTGTFESRPEVQNMLLRIMESADLKDETTTSKIVPSDSELEKAQKTEDDPTDKHGEVQTDEKSDETRLSTASEKSSLVVTNSDSSPSYRIILLILILMYYSREINKGFMVPDQALDILQHLELCRSRPLPNITPEPIEA